MSTTYAIGNIQHSLQALKEVIPPEKWSETPLPVIAAPGWWLDEVRKDMGLADGTIAEIHGCAVTQVDALTEPKLIDHDGKTYSILPQWQRAKAEDTEGGEAA
jgi:hypothetical protein